MKCRKHCIFSHKNRKRNETLSLDIWRVVNDNSISSTTSQQKFTFLIEFSFKKFHSFLNSFFNSLVIHFFIQWMSLTLSDETLMETSTNTRLIMIVNNETQSKPSKTFFSLIFILYGNKIVVDRSLNLLTMP